MHSYGSKRARRGLRLVELLVVVVIPGILAAIVIPRYTGASQDASGSKLQTLLKTIRSQIELYNVQNPFTAYDAATALGTFWNPLLQGGYLREAPGNPLQNNSTTVSAAPTMGSGWVWAEGSPGDTWTLNFYAVDENGQLYDSDGNGNPD